MPGLLGDTPSHLFPYLFLFPLFPLFPLSSKHLVIDQTLYVFSLHFLNFNFLCACISPIRFVNVERQSKLEKDAVKNIATFTEKDSYIPVVTAL